MFLLFAFSHFALTTSLYRHFTCAVSCEGKNLHPHSLIHPWPFTHTSTHAYCKDKKSLLCRNRQQHRWHYHVLKNCLSVLFIQSMEKTSWGSKFCLVVWPSCHVLWVSTYLHIIVNLSVLFIKLLGCLVAKMQAVKFQPFKAAPLNDWNTVNVYQGWPRFLWQSFPTFTVPYYLFSPIYIYIYDICQTLVSRLTLNVAH